MDNTINAYKDCIYPNSYAEFIKLACANNYIVEVMSDQVTLAITEDKIIVGRYDVIHGQDNFGAMLFVGADAERDYLECELKYL